GATEDDGERLLPRRRVATPGVAQHRFKAPEVRREPSVAFLQTRERFMRADHCGHAGALARAIHSSLFAHKRSATAGSFDSLLLGAGRHCIRYCPATSVAGSCTSPTADVAAPCAGLFVNGLTSFTSRPTTAELRPICVVTSVPGCSEQAVRPCAPYLRCNDFAINTLQSFACP